MEWITKKEEFMKEFDDLNSTTDSGLKGQITELNKAVKQYIDTAGLSQTPENNPNYTTIQEKLNNINHVKQQYNKLNDNIKNYLSDQTKKTDWNTQLVENGTMQTEINKLEKIQKEMKVDVESAVARDELLRTRNTNVSRHDLFLFNHPIRRSLVPYLWVLSILFIGIALLIFKSTFPKIALQTNETSSFMVLLLMITEFFSNSYVIISLVASALIVILVLSLKIAGVF